MPRSTTGKSTTRTTLDNHESQITAIRSTTDHLTATQPVDLDAVETGVGVTMRLAMNASRTLVFSDSYISVFWDGSSNQFQPFFTLTSAYNSWIDGGQFVILDQGSSSTTYALDTAYLTDGPSPTDIYFSDGGAYDSAYTPSAGYSGFALYFLAPETSTTLPSYVVTALFGQNAPAGAVCLNVRRY